MKKAIFFSIIILFTSLSCYAQEETLVEVISGTRYLNNPARIGGASRLSIPVNLPYNTVRWYYVIYAYRDGNEVARVQQQFNLFSQLTRLYDQSGTTANLMSLLTAPNGGTYCNVYLLSSYADANKFTNILNTYSYYPNGSSKHVSSWKQEVAWSNLISGTQYIGVENPTFGYGLNLGIQVVAVVAN